MEVIATELEAARELWATIARDNGWYSEPFYVQAWVDDAGHVIDAVSTTNMTRDYLVPV